MPPTITYIYGLKKHLFMLISTTTTKSQNVAPRGTTRTVKYLTFCQDSHTPNRILAEKPGKNQIKMLCLSLSTAIYFFERTNLVIDTIFIL